MTERMTAARLAGLKKKRGGTKRVAGAHPTTVDGIKFHSKREAARWMHLRGALRLGLISDLRRQVRFELFGANGPIMTDSGERVRTYVADFVYFDEVQGREIVEDAKGFATEVYKIKRSILAAQGVHIVEV